VRIIPVSSPTRISWTIRFIFLSRIIVQFSIKEDNKEFKHWQS
jgi:hypothetical protein